jgi:betaine-aldehyde dehydrogenase
MGPVVSAEHRDRVENCIKSGVEEGAKLILGGKRPTAPPLDRGYFVMPAVFTDVTQNMKIAREEIFGPVACFIKFSSDEEVIRLANDSTFGLSASVWTRNTTKGIRFANEIQAGTVWINGEILGAEYPWGGYKESGFGKENSILGLEEYVQIKAISFDLAGKV